MPTIAEVRPAVSHAFFDVAGHAVAVSCRWAGEIRDVVCALMGPGPHRLAVDRTNVIGVEALRSQGFVLVEGQRLLELARSIKSPGEIACRASRWPWPISPCRDCTRRCGPE